MSSESSENLEESIVEIPPTEETSKPKKHFLSKERLAQLAAAREKALQIKRKRAAPQKELKKLENDIKERLYKEDLERVKNLRILHANAPQRQTPMLGKPNKADVHFEKRMHHLDELVNILYS